MNKILLLGKNGQLGWELQRTLAPLGEMVAIDREDVDLAQPEKLREIVAGVRPQMIVNASAFTDVDGAESSPELALAINRTAPAILAAEAGQLGIPIVHYSTDFIFDGSKGQPYCETDSPNPLNMYGRSKWEGEQAVQSVGKTYLILRTSWVYSLRGNGFVSKVLRWAREKDTLRVVDDQIGSPTWARLLAEMTALVLAQTKIQGLDWLQERAGIYHLAGLGSVSRLDWARAILSLDASPQEQRCKVIEPCKSNEFPTPAHRPLYSALNCEKFMTTFGLLIPDWKENLRLAMDTSVFTG
jgi:dTDP-4-dehydrorhamnose reductase